MYIPSEIWIDSEAQNHFRVKQICDNYPDTLIKIVSDEEQVKHSLSQCSDPFIKGKKILFLTLQRGEYNKPCPCTPHHVCCNYRFINLITNCPFSCSYCILQAYLNFPATRVYLNWEEGIESVKKLFSEDPTEFYRFGTGELSDSLALEPGVPLAEFLIDFFSRQNRGILELKTKSVQIQHLLSLNHQKKTFLAWSLNTEQIQKEEEYGAETIVKRISSAKSAVLSGYPVGFHFDPMIIQNESKIEEYLKIADLLGNTFQDNDLSWISLGSLRYMPEMKEIIRERYPHSSIIYGEFIRGEDGKSRYYKKIRVSAYQKLYERLREFFPKVPVYLCMEREDVYEKVFGIRKNSDMVRKELDDRAKYLMGI